MKAAELRSKSVDELKEELINLRQEQFNLRMQRGAGQLANPIFLDITNRLDPFLWLRFIGGTMYLVGAIMMAINFWQTIRGPGETAAADAVPVGAD